MPDVRNCKKCGRIFNYIGGTQICYTCRQTEEEDFQRIKKYLYENPGATITQVSTDLEVSIEKIKRFLREGRLEITGDDGNMILECENCGKSIKSGRYCYECERTLTSVLKTTASQMRSDMSSSREASGQSSLMKYRNKP